MPSITSEEVAQLARLARLQLSEDELHHLAGQLDGILTAVARVSEVAGEDVPATSHALALANVTRPDEIRPSLDPEETLAAAPATENARFRVPRILDEEL